jgi:GNAT superfamily N-acetyltransferase
MTGRPGTHEADPLVAGGRTAPRVVTIGAEDLDRVRDLWEQMRLAYIEMTPDHPIRGAEESWARARATYERHLLCDGGFVLALEGERSRILAYAAVTLVEPSAVFAWSDRVAELATLVVTADARGTGLGELLMEAVGQQTRARGCGELRMQVLSANERAMRFYRRLGFTDWIVTLHDVAETADGRARRLRDANTLPTTALKRWA